MQPQLCRHLRESQSRARVQIVGSRRGHVIEAPWLVNGGHGASLRHHKRRIIQWLTFSDSIEKPVRVMLRFAHAYLRAPASQLSHARHVDLLRRALSSST
jgi:hypothetical protein